MFRQLYALRDKFPKTLKPTKEYRGLMTGLIEQVVKNATVQIGYPLERPELRTMRLRLATAVYKRTITSFNELTDAELWALRNWVADEATRKIALENIKGWIKENYGAQLSMGIC